MAYTDYEKFREEYIPSGVDLVTRRPLEVGQFSAYGTNTVGDIITPTVNNANPVPSYPNIDRSTMPPINIPNVARPVSPPENPANMPLSETQLMERRQAMRGEGMSVARRKQVLGQIASEGGRISGQQAKAQEQQEADAAFSKQLQLKQAGWTGAAAQTRLGLKEMEITGKKDIQAMKQTADQAKYEYVEAQKTGRQDVMIAARTKWQNAEFDHEAEQLKTQGKIVGSSQWMDAMQAKANQMIQVGAVKDKSQADRLIYSKGMDAISNEVRNFTITPEQAKQQIDQLSATMTGKIPKTSEPVAATGKQTDANQNGIPDSVEAEYNAIFNRLEQLKTAPKPDPAAIAKATNALKVVKSRMIPQG